MTSRLVVGTGGKVGDADTGADDAIAVTSVSAGFVVVIEGDSSLGSLLGYGGSGSGNGRLSMFFMLEFLPRCAIIDFEIDCYNYAAQLFFG